MLLCSCTYVQYAPKKVPTTLAYYGHGVMRLRCYIVFFRMQELDDCSTVVNEYFSDAKK